MSGKKSNGQNEHIETTLARMSRVKILAKVQLAAVVICWSAIALSIWLKFSGGRSDAIVVISGFGGIMGLISYLIGKYIERCHSEFEEIRNAFIEADRRIKMNSKPAGSTGKVPLTVGFANLIGESMASTVNEDAKEISYLFLSSIVPPPHQIPRAEVLFVYANLGDDGTISPEGKSGIRQIIQLTSSAIVVVASPNSPASIKMAMELPGPKTANIVFTLDRNGREFGKFFRGLFGKMRDGKEMLSAWAELAPQIPGGASAVGPQTLLVAEGGKLAFTTETST